MHKTSYQQRRILPLRESPMYFLFAAPALSFVGILAMTLHSQFVRRANL